MSDTYLIIKESQEVACKLFSKHVAGNSGLVVTRDYCNKPSNNIDKIWITNIDTTVSHLKPQEIEQLCYEIEKYMVKNKGSAVLITATNYLISFNSFKEVLHLIQDIKDHAVLNNIVLYVYLGKNTLDEKEENLLKQELEMAGDN